MALLFYDPNVHSTCIAILADAGWVLHIEPRQYEIDDSLWDMYVAEKDGTIIKANDPVQLLGLASIHSHLAPHSNEPYWWAVDDLGLLEQIEDNAVEKSFFDFKKREPEKCIKYIREEMEKSQSDPSTPIYERLGISKTAWKAIKAELKI